jgi:hypothetical protein
VDEGLGGICATNIIGVQCGGKKRQYVGLPRPRPFVYGAELGGYLASRLAVEEGGSFNEDILRERG